VTSYSCSLPFRAWSFHSDALLGASSSTGFRASHPASLVALKIAGLQRSSAERCRILNRSLPLSLYSPLCYKCGKASAA